MSFWKLHNNPLKLKKEPYELCVGIEKSGPLCIRVVRFCIVTNQFSNRKQAVYEKHCSACSMSMDRHIRKDEDCVLQPINFSFCYIPHLVKHPPMLVAPSIHQADNRNERHAE